MVFLIVVGTLGLATAALGTAALVMKNKKDKVAKEKPKTKVNTDKVYI